MKWFRRRRAEGGWISPRDTGDDVPIRLSRGVAIIPDSGDDPDLVRRLNGRDDVDVYTVSEWMAAEEEE